MIVLLLLLLWLVVRLVVSARRCNRLGTRVLKWNLLRRWRMLMFLRSTTTTFGCNNGTGLSAAC
jgi:hypothetical protein